MGERAAKRVDLHCHSSASNRPNEAILGAISCQECYSDPHAIFAQAKARGMDFVTITDHDTIDGVMRLAGRPEVLTGEELTCFFPEDGCKMHVVVWGITPADHAELQARAKDIYRVAEYLEEKQIAHAVAHPIYSQNDKLTRGHLERLILLFKGLECLNGQHSPLHREAFEPLLDELNEQRIAELSQKHGIPARWHRPWVKSRTGGSDDHGQLSIGCTWTEFPPEAATVADVLQCLREGCCRPAGEAGSATKLAHTIYSIAVRYYGRHLLSPGDKPNLPTVTGQILVGERPMPSSAELARLAAGVKVRRWTRWLPWRRKPETHQPKLPQLFLNALRGVLEVAPSFRGTPRNLAEVTDRLDSSEYLGMTAGGASLPPLGETEAMAGLMASVNRRITQDIAGQIMGAIDAGRFTALFDAIGSAAAQQFLLLPYYFALFHQNKDRPVLRQISGVNRPLDARKLRVGLFTDVLDTVNGVSRFLGDISALAAAAGRSLTIHTCAANPTADIPGRRNFVPVLSRLMPYYPDLPLCLPPVLEILQWADAQQFDIIHASTPGPMGLCGWLVSRMLRVPLVGTFHTDIPSYIAQLCGDHRIAGGSTAYLRWFYGQMDRVFARSRAYRASLRSLGVADEKLAMIEPAIDTRTFRPSGHDGQIWRELGIRHRHRLLYAGRVSVEKNLGLLADVYERLRREGIDAALIVAGDGPYRAKMQERLAGLPVHFLGQQSPDRMRELYSAADLLMFPSRTDTLGQVVMEALACGLPALVSDEGGPRELVTDGATGRVLPGNDAHAWASAVRDLLADAPRRREMGDRAVAGAQGYSLSGSFDAFWAEHLAVAQR